MSHLTARSVLLATLCVGAATALCGCAPTVVEDRNPDTTIVQPPSGDTKIVPVPTPGPSGPAGPAGPSGPAGAPGAPGR